MTIRAAEARRPARPYDDPSPPSEAAWQEAVRTALADRAGLDHQPPQLRPDETAHRVEPGETVWTVANGDLADAAGRNPQIPELGEIDAGDVVFVKAPPAPTQPTAAPPPYAPTYDAKSNPALVLRSDLAARYLGGTANGRQQPPPEQTYGVPTEKLAETMADGNPLEQAAYASMYGGTDPVTGKTHKPLWEEMGMSREALRQIMTERPWDIASHHLGRPISEKDYAELQKVDGPLGHLLNLGVDPPTALSIQATWSAHFHGGYDPITQAQLRPVWERWGLTSASQLTTLFENSPAATIKLSGLTGGTDPIGGKPIPPPWGDKSAEAYGAAQLKQSQTILGIEVLPDIRKVVSAEDAESFALGFTTPSGSGQADYVNPIQFAQSPTFRNGLQAKGGNIIVSSLMDPLGGVGLFGLVKGYPPQFVQGLDQKVIQGGGDPRKVKYQFHGITQVLPQNGEAVVLIKAQRLPKALKGETKDPDSQFAKVMAHWTEAGGGVTLFVGKGDETDGSRGRSPRIVGVNWSNAPDGTINRFGTALAGPFGQKGPFGSGKWHAGGLQFQMGKNDAGDWVPTGLGTVTEWGTNRYQVWPMLTWDPNGGGVTGGSMMVGTGWTLGQVGVLSDPSSPQTHLNLLGGGTDGRTPNVTYSDPSVFGFDLGGMYGKDGRAVGVGFSKSSSSNVEVSVDIDNGDTRAAEEKAKAYHGKLARGEISVLDLPKGVRVASTAQNATSGRAMAFLYLFNAGGSLGSGNSVKTDISRTGDNTWTVARYDEPSNDWSVNGGIYGVGPGFQHWDAHMRGESIAVTAPPGPDGKLGLQGPAREALDRYLKEGLIPGATSMEGRFAGDGAGPYRSLRDKFLETERRLQDVRAKPASTDQARESERLQALSNAEKDYGERRSDLNDFIRRTLNPGDEIMPGIRIATTSKRDTEGSRPSFVVPLDAKTITRGETKTENNTYHTFELKRRPLFGWDYDNQNGQRTGAGNDVYQLSSTGTLADNEGHLSHYLPLPVIKTVQNRSVYPPLWDEAVKKKAEMRGTLSIEFTDAQIVALGNSMSSGPDGQALWTSFANRTSGAFEDQFLQKNPEYRDNNQDLHTFTEAAKDAARKHGLKGNDLVKIFAGVRSPEAFAKLRDNEQEAFIDVIGLSASADHSPYESVALIAAVPSEDRRSALFKRVIDNIATKKQPIFSEVNRGPGRDNRYGDLGPLDRGLDRELYYDDPTVEFVRFLTEDVKDPGIRDTFLKQSGFRSELPKEIESRRGKTLDSLSKEATQKYKEEMTIYFTGGPKPTRYLALTHDKARDMVGILAAVGEQTGSDGVWTFMKERRIEPGEIFARLRDKDGRDRVLRQALVDVLRPGALGQDAKAIALLDSVEAKARQ